MTSTKMNGHTTALTMRPKQEAAIAHLVETMPWDDLVRMGEQLVKTRMMPEHVKDGASAALIMLTGRELGMQPMRALRSLQVVKGKVIESADSQLSRFKADGGHAKFLHLDETKAVLWLKHPNGDEHTETWSAADSQKAGLSGGMHAKFAKAMFRSRAITAGLKSVGWEGGVGAYDPEEARSFTGPEVETTATTVKVVEPAETSRPHPAARDAASDDVVIARLRVEAAAEMDRLQIGAGMDEAGKRSARNSAISRLCGRTPKKAEEWVAALDILRQEPTPTHVEYDREPGSDDDKDVGVVAP